MPVAFKSKLSSTVVNSTFMDKTINDSTIGQLELANTDVASGSTVSNIQREINKNIKTISVATLFLNSDQITLDTLSMVQVFRVAGNLAPATLNSLVFSNQPLDGAEIMLIGQDDTNTITISLNDVQFGQYVNGDAELKRGYILRMIYDATLERFLEVGRNF